MSFRNIFIILVSYQRHNSLRLYTKLYNHKKTVAKINNSKIDVMQIFYSPNGKKRKKGEGTEIYPSSNYTKNCREFLLI